MANPGGPSFSHKRVCVIGAGGLGCAVLPRLARMRIASLTVIDGDRVEEKNLERQPIFEEMDIGHFKAGTAAGWMRQILVGGTVNGHDVFIDAMNVHELIDGHDVVVEGVDDLHAKQLIDRVCAELGVPLVSGGVHQQQGQVIVLHATGTNTELTREQLFAGRPSAQQDGCDMRDVPIELLDEVGRYMAHRTRQLLLEEPQTNGIIDLYDARSGKWMSIEPPR